MFGSDYQLCTFHNSLALALEVYEKYTKLGLKYCLGEN